MAERLRKTCFVFDERTVSFAKSENCIFEPPCGGIEVYMSTLYKSFNAKKLCSTVSSILFVKQ